MNSKKPEISIVLPAYNEESNIPVIFSALTDVLQEERYEIIFVDDGSSDDTVRSVKRLKRKSPSIVRLIRLSRNFGHQAALMAGISSANGRAIITMDCDMQHPPECLQQMLAEWRKGHKIVRMVRKRTVKIGFWKNMLSSSFYRALNWVSEYPVLPGAADFQLLDRDVTDSLNKINNRQHFIRGFVSWVGFNPVNLEYTAPQRYSGEASYSLWQSIKLAKTALFSMSRIPLRLGIYVGLLVAICCFLYVVYSLSSWLGGQTIPGWTSLMVVVLLLGSIQIIILGIIGEYIGQIYDLQRNLPSFVCYSEDVEKPEEGASIDH